MDEFNELHSKILSEIKKNGSCVEGYEDIFRSSSISEISKHVKKWWNEVLDMHLESSLHLFSDFFSKFEKEFNTNGIYFNQDAPEGYAIIYNGKARLSGNALGRSFGCSQVETVDSSSLISFGKTKVNVRDCSKVELREQSSGVMYDESEVTAYDSVYVVCQGGKTLHLAGTTIAEVHHCGSIYAYGDSRVKNVNPRMERRIYLYEQSSMI
ncbi:hypothetical protein [Bacteroides sp.]|uniref:hypothetical protein n=1 Tax=Bacteroides sp. TaxID=29523 RepID=UPI00260D10DA|nr:hypothetical protein [Bacteroides sp.]MDD3037891.1 hypothetical protein [Bacteroides sp.]